jgi:WhiB family redox-sensing transcriptional regulator
MESVRLPDHGTRARYNKKCRCGACIRANAAYKNRWRARQGVNLGEQETTEGLKLPVTRVSVPDWTGAACLEEVRAGRASHSWWAKSTDNPEVAVEICDRCPIQPACLTWALEYPEPVGIWGGKTARERNGHDEKLGRPKSRKAMSE